MTDRIKIRFKMPENSKLHSPYAYLYVAKGGVDEGGFQMLSSNIAGEIELDSAINLLIKDLETLRKTGKSKFKEYKKK